VTAIWLAYETKSLLIGERAKRHVVQGIRALASGQEHVVQVNEVLTLHMGPDYVLVNISANFEDAATADQIEATVANLDRRIKAAYPEVKRVFVEGEARRQPVPAGQGRA
jgi:divalent metal cation (Fe/Co/Zn/Cd) transporter